MGLKSTGVFEGMFGNGVDGDVVISSETTLSRDMFYNNLIVSGTAAGAPIIHTNGYRIYVKNRLLFVTSGTFECTGSSGGTNGTGAPKGGAAGTLGGGVIGTAGLAAGVLQVGNAGDTTPIWGGAGGNGGMVSNGGTAAGGAGSTNFVSGSSGSLRSVFSAMYGFTFGPNMMYSAVGGGAGGGGGANTSFASCPGGGGGGVMVIVAKEIVTGVSGTYVMTASLSPGYPFSGVVAPFSGTTYAFFPGVTGTFDVRGGTGGSSSNSGGAGGGGGGGVIILVTAKRSGSLVTLYGGGNAGTGGSIPALSGSSGSLYLMDL